jgi:hypothetical protein
VVVGRGRVSVWAEETHERSETGRVDERRLELAVDGVPMFS